MIRDRKKIKKEKKRLKAIREMKEQRNIAKHTPDLIFPRKRDTRFSDPKKKE